jgi:hypothetical protein
MTLVEMVTAVQGAFGARFQVSNALVLQYLDTVQKVAFNRDMKAFLWTQDYLTVYQDVVLSSSGYTSFVAADVGRTLTGTTGTGTIISYNNALFTVQVSTTGATFTGAITTSGGTGAGTFSSQSVSEGPYSWASLAPTLGSLTPFTSPAGVRRMLGVTSATDIEIYGQNPTVLTRDYGFMYPVFDERAAFEVVRKYDMQKALYFINTPSTTANTYRWVYYIRPPTIGLTTDDANVLIPAEFHQTCMVEGAQALADRAVYGDKTPEQALAEILTPFWDMMAQAYTPDGTNNNFTSDGQL